MDRQTELEVQAAVFRRLIAHFDERKDVQNIDLMNLAGFCRNCLSKWYLAEAEARSESITYDEAREVIYKEPYEQWKEKYQKEATQAQLEQYNRKANNE